MCRCGTSGHGLAGMVVLGWQLDLKFLEVFSNLNYSIILYGLDTCKWATDSCPNGAEMFSRCRKEVGNWRCEDHLYLSSASCLACQCGEVRVTYCPAVLRLFTRQRKPPDLIGKCEVKSPEPKAQHDLRGNPGITLPMRVGSTSTEMNGSQLLQAAT